MIAVLGMWSLLAEVAIPVVSEYFLDLLHCNVWVLFMCHEEALYFIRTNFSFASHRYCASYNNHLCVGSARILLYLCHGLCLCKCRLSTQEAKADNENRMNINS